MIESAIFPAPTKPIFAFESSTFHFLLLFFPGFEHEHVFGIEEDVGDGVEVPLRAVSSAFSSARLVVSSGGGPVSDILF